jgi:GT2 family glycosyltransferase
LRDNPISTSTVVVRREHLQRVGGFDEAPEFRAIEDYELWLRLSVNAPMRVLAQPLATYRISLTERERMPLLHNKLRIFEKHVGLGYLTAAAAAGAAAAIYFAMGALTFTIDAHKARESFRTSRDLADTRGGAAAAAFAAAATRLPRRVRTAVFRMARWVNKWVHIG